ncbi:hypothetical protein I3842_14G093800 [Carya illinoinensis]|uniref:Uncharacterized protein n=1 Tax=Carya illinoinensis TaxID=32201 RepID=A0A922DD12_CARIL|nr:hypothetical protein I3842_14G093800 [Carya illinoinensis]KAG6678696.1 hypothetical protein I3842_14G093800 [Carya illinoinensis]KAG6678699.1 hypothetical protein I3842_14G093800 [Carya illinoinensis]KAG6678700.1 hypothetical protein I3842_14G093800 [Carya illinoinensis]
MGISSSKIEEDKALQLCRERKKFVRQSLDGRCSLAAAHVTYIQSLKSTGIVLSKFVEPEAPIESSLYTSTTATPEPLALTEKSLSQFSFSPPSISQHVYATETISPSPSPNSSQFQANQMTFRSSSSQKIEEKLSLPVTGTVTSSSTPQNMTPRSTERPGTSPFQGSSLPPGTPPWDYFGLFHPTDHEFSFQDGKGMYQGLENADDIRQYREEEGIPDLEDEEEKTSSHEREESLDSEGEFDEPSTDTLVRSFENLNRVRDHAADNSLHSMPSAQNVALETEFLNREKENSPYLSPMRATSKVDHAADNSLHSMPSAQNVALETEFLNREKENSPYLSPMRATSKVVALPTDQDKAPSKEDCIESKVPPKDFFSSMRDIEFLFIKASESGKEVPRMLEANKLNFRPIFPGKERGGSMTSELLKTCFSCGEDPSQVQEEPAENDTKYLTWHRTTSSRSSSTRNPLGANSRDDIEDFIGNSFENFCMNSGSHASTLDRLYAWERKLYDEVKASGMVRREYDLKCKTLRQLETNGESTNKIDKTRAVVKDLHSRIRVAIHRIDSISKRIEELRDKELQPQLEELIEGLSRMWKVMSECHKLQYDIIKSAQTNGNTKLSIQSESHRQVTIHLEDELSSLSSSFLKWFAAQKFYLQAISGWLYKCAPVPQKSSKRKRKSEARSLRDDGPPIYVTCGNWLAKLKDLEQPESSSIKQVVDTIKDLGVATARFIPHQEKNQGKDMNRSYLPSWKAGKESDSENMLGGEAVHDWISGFDRFRSSLEAFIGQLNNFAELSMKMYVELQQEIEKAKSSYDRLMSRSQVLESKVTETTEESQHPSESEVQ